VLASVAANHPQRKFRSPQFATVIFFEDGRVRLEAMSQLYVAGYLLERVLLPWPWFGGDGIEKLYVPDFRGDWARPATSPQLNESPPWTDAPAGGAHLYLYPRRDVVLIKRNRSGFNLFTDSVALGHRDSRGPRTQQNLPQADSGI